jgi:AraC-like DNA-binding protein
LRHLEFFHNEHFEDNYHRVPPHPILSRYIDFFWETKFEQLWSRYPKGFSDAQFPNIGYTYIINLGSPFIMQVEDKKFRMKTDGFVPRYHAIECFHKPGNHFFGIKFRISPILFQKKINFSEYKNYVFPLSYLLDQAIIDQVKKAVSFQERINILSSHFHSLVGKETQRINQVTIVSDLLRQVSDNNYLQLSLKEEAAKNNLSVRTLQRYFENVTGINSKQALQVIRIRKAIMHLLQSPDDFKWELYGYYDRSHFYKHLKQFLLQNTMTSRQPHLKLLELLNR